MSDFEYNDEEDFLDASVQNDANVENDDVDEVDREIIRPKNNKSPRSLKHIVMFRI